MKPVQTDACNVTLTLPGGTKANDLPAERCYFKDPDGPLDTPGELGFETTWLPDEREREAVAAGAPILLRVWGAGHPPVKLDVPEVPDDRRGLTRDHADRALGSLLESMHAAGMIDQLDSAAAAKVATLWQDAIDATSELAQQVGQALDQLGGEYSPEGGPIPEFGVDPETRGEAELPPLDEQRRCNCPPSVRVDHPTDDSGNCPTCEAPR